MLTENLMNKFKDIINIGVGNSAEILKNMIEEDITINVPSVTIMSYEFLKKHFEGHQVSVVSLDFSGELSGTAHLVFFADSAEKFILAFNRGLMFDVEEIYDIKSETLSEIGNIMLNSLIGSISNTFNINLVYNPPDFFHSTAAFTNNTDLMENNLIAKTNFHVKNINVYCEILIFFDAESIEKLKLFMN